ncbi:MAG: DinB family protein [Acidobacteriaceae bacterium]
MKVLKSAVLSAAALTTTLATTMVLLPAVGHAQSSNPITAALKASLQRSSHIMAAAAEQMPADKYSFKPTAGSRTFGGLVLHIGNANRAACHWLTGAPAAPKNDLTPSSPKAQLVASLKSSFDYCDGALGNFNDSKLSDRVPFFGGRTLSVAASVLLLTDDWADHYSQEAAYLRANGMLPPTAHHGQP